MNLSQPTHHRDTASTATTTALHLCCIYAVSTLRLKSSGTHQSWKNNSQIWEMGLSEQDVNAAESQ